MDPGTPHDIGQWLSLAGVLAALWRIWGYVIAGVESRIRIDERTNMLIERVKRLEAKSDR